MELESISQSQSLLTWILGSDSSTEIEFENCTSIDFQEEGESTVVEITTLGAQVKKDMGENSTLFPKDKTCDVTPQASINESVEDGWLSEKALSADLFTQPSTGMDLPEMSHQDIVDALGIVEDCSPDLFSQTSEESCAIPSREYFMEEEIKLSRMVTKSRQELQDHKLATLLSKGIDATTQRRSLRNSQKQKASL
ncbi:unnamed protein product [Allacma fusca]|uniref:Uncharacterized protein n=1 Tax=Allacma fusca TaxID=39272 RepID=A0A8J2JYW3_9HEXA|nr:unnamed protein product [Allacma fusca]